MSASAYVTTAICVFIIALFLYFMIRWNEKSVSQAPGLLTMIGIGGTFFGIASGLLAFQATDVQGSIPGLINGIRTAIWASFAGVLGAILLKGRYALGGNLDLAEAAVDDDPVAAEIRSLRKAIIGEDDSSIITQLKLGRIDTNTRLDNIARLQDESMKRLAEMSSKALIEALREVISDFNTKINEQFGENFKHLNEAVGKLLTWQEEYKTQLNILIGTQNAAATQMQQAVVQYKATLERAQTLVTVANELRSILISADAYKENLARNTEILAKVVGTMIESTPKLQSSIEDLVSSVKQSVIRNEEDVKRIGREISSNFETASDAVRDTVTTSLASANKAVNDNITRLLGSTKELTESLQTELEASLTTSLETLSAQLASLSSRFADDYGPIADRLREIVKASV